MKAWTKIVARPTKANLAFALFSLLALFVVAWSRTDFSPPQTPIPASGSQHNSALYVPLNIQLGPNVQEIAPIDSNSASSSGNNRSRAVPSSVTVEPSRQSSSQSPLLVAPIVQTITDTLTNGVLAPSTSLTIDVPTVDPTDQPDCASVLVLDTCLN